MMKMVALHADLPGVNVRLTDTHTRTTPQVGSSENLRDKVTETILVELKNKPWAPLTHPLARGGPQRFPSSTSITQRSPTSSSQVKKRLFPSVASVRLLSVPGRPMKSVMGRSWPPFAPTDHRLSSSTK